MPSKIAAINSMNDKFSKLIDLTRKNGPEAFTAF